MSLLSLFRRGPTIQKQHFDRWLVDREGVMAEIRAKTSGPFISDEILKEYRDVLEGERFVDTYEKAVFDERAKKSRDSALKSSRFTRLRQRRGLPFQSRRQP